MNLTNSSTGNSILAVENAHKTCKSALEREEKLLFYMNKIGWKDFFSACNLLHTILDFKSTKVAFATLFRCSFK